MPVVVGASDAVMAMRSDVFAPAGGVSDRQNADTKAQQRRPAAMAFLNVQNRLQQQSALNLDAENSSKKRARDTNWVGVFSPGRN